MVDPQAHTTSSAIKVDSPSSTSTRTQHDLRSRSTHHPRTSHHATHAVFVGWELRSWIQACYWDSSCAPKKTLRSGGRLWPPSPAKRSSTSTTPNRNTPLDPSDLAPWTKWKHGRLETRSRDIRRGAKSEEKEWQPVAVADVCFEGALWNHFLSLFSPGKEFEITCKEEGGDHCTSQAYRSLQIVYLMTSTIVSRATTATYK